MKKQFIYKSFLIVSLCFLLASCSGTNNSKQSKASPVSQNDLSEEEIQDILFDGYKAQAILQTEENSENPVVGTLKMCIIGAYSFYVDDSKIEQITDKIDNLNINPDEFEEINVPFHGKVFTLEDSENNLYFLYTQRDTDEQTGFLFTLQKEILDSSTIQDMKNGLKDSPSDAEKMTQILFALATNKNLVEYYAMKNVKIPSGKTKRILIECVSEDNAE